MIAHSIQRRAAYLCALLCAIAYLIAPAEAAAQGVLTGRVAARGQVLRDESGKLTRDPTGKPSWVEYIHNEQRPLSNSYARDPNAVAMSAADYNRLANQVVVDPTKFSSVLVDITTKKLLYPSPGVIGRETAFMYGGTDPGTAQGLSEGCKSAPGTDWAAASSNFSNCPPGAMIEDSKLMVWAPVVGARLEMISYGEFNYATSQPTGWYTLPYQIQLDEDFVFDVDATLAYANFNPRVPSSRQFILTRKNNISDLTRSLQVGSFSIPYSRQSQFTNFPVEIAMVRINAKLVNTDASFADLHPGIKLVGLGVPATEAHKAANLTQYVVHPTDQDQGLVQQISASDLLDSELYVYTAADDRMIGSRWGLYPNEINNEPSSDDPNTPEDESASRSTDFSMVTLIRGPSAMNRGLYIPEYNPATRIAEVRDTAGNVIKPGREGLELDYNPNPGQSGIPLLHEGDAIKIILINRATGYTGVASARVHTSPSGITEIVAMNGEPIELDLRPPRLRIEVQRHFTVKQGANVGDERHYIVGFEGSGLNTDTAIDIHTEWVGIAPDGSDVLLPESLLGFTGRLAYVDEAQDGSTAPPGGPAGGAPLVQLKPAGCTDAAGSTASACIQDRTGLFQIGGKPSTVVAVLPQGRDRGHLYVHIDAQPMQRNVDFSGHSAPDFSINEACRCADPAGCAPASNGWECGATAVLKPRPMSFVPFLVPFQGAPESGQPPDPPTWKYRPEMQFSLLDFQAHHLNVKTDKGQTRDVLKTSSTLDSADGKVQLIYDLLRDPVAELPRLGDPRTLAFTIGNQRHDATLAVEKTANGNVIDFTNIGALKGASPADFLTIRLVQNGNEANVLWEYRFNDAKIILEDGKGSIAPGDTGKALVVADPAWPGAVWSHVESDDGVDATIDASTGVIKASEKSKQGFFTIRAVRQDDATQFAIARIPIGCECLTCKAEGTCNTYTGSIHAEFALGPTPGGGGAGLIVLHDEALSDLIYTPRLLKVDTLNTDTEALYDGNGLRQVIAPNTFVDIHVPPPVAGNPPPETYEMLFYPRSALGPFSDGLYDIKPSATPTATWHIYNPTPGLYSTLRIVGQLEHRAEPDAREFRVQNGIVTLLEGTMDGDTFKPLRTEEQQETVVDDLRSVRKTVRDNAGNIASVVLSTYETIDDKPMLVAEVIDPDGAALTTTHTYHRTVDPGAGAYTGQRASTQHPDGSWTKWLYDDHGRVISEQHAWLDSPFTSPSSQVRVIDYSYIDPASITPPGAIHFGQQPPDEDFHRPRVTTERITGIVVSKTFLSIQRAADGSRVETEERCPQQTCSYGASDNLRTVRRYYPKDPTDPQGNDSGMLESVQHPDGRLDSYSYERGTVENGSFRPGAGDALRTTVTHGTVNHPDGIAYRSTEDVTTTDDIGQSILDETHVYTGADHELLTSTARTYDDSGRLLRTEQSNGEVTTTEWGCCSENGSTDSRGITTTVLARDALNRVTAEQRAGITTTRTYDAGGRELTVTRSGGDLQLTSSRRYDNAGRLTQSRDEQGLLTTYSYDPNGRRTTVTRPGGFTEISDQYADGQAKSTTGTATVAQYLSHGVDPDGSRVVETRTARPDSPAFERTITDLLGRTIRTERPAFGGGLEVAASYFNTKGQLARTSTTGMADTLYEYDELGDQTRSALDVDDNGAVDLASTDRVQESDTHFTSIDGAWWQESISRIYPETGAAAAVITGSTRNRVSAGSSLSEQVTVDIYGNETRSTVTVNRAQRTETRRTDAPDSIIDAVTISVDGRVVSSTTPTGIATAYDYDGLGRRAGVTDPRTGRSVTSYDPATGRVITITDPATHATTFGYDSNTGRKTRECNALGKCSYFAYSDRGELIRTWGDVPYPVEYVYDDHGRRTEMRTFRVDLGWSAPTWPDGAEPAGDTTTWEYDESTGLLLAKRDAAGKAVTYSYGLAGRLATRTWAPQKPGGGPLTTSYGYNASTGQLLSVNYNDSTPDVTYVYDRVGRQSSVTDGTGSHAFGYDPTTLLPTQESTTGIVPALLTRSYDLTGVKGRPTGIGLGDGYAVGYSYDVTGRMQHVSWTLDAHSDGATYSYLSNGQLLAGITTTSGQSTTYQYEPHRDLKIQVANRFGGTLVSQYEYAYDAVGRRTSVKNSGSAFAQPAFSRWGYDERNQLTVSDRFLGAVLTDTSNPVNPEARGYDYDGVGNRKTSTAAGTQTAYVANELNQYETVGASAPTYDDDGNLINDGTKSFKYNAEHQLIEVLVPGVSRSTFAYDYLGRRVKKTVDVLDGSGPDYSVTWIYAGWSKVEERKTVGSTTTTKNFVWGLDVSQSMEGAGGIGGLLAVVDQAGDEHLFSYDGNGNVGQLVNSTSGTLDARYEYDAYGNLIVGIGTQAQENAYRFSTKYADDDTGLVDYGYRYYEPVMGRWVNRDPAEEQGGKNLYGFVGNEPFNAVDPLGLDTYLLFVGDEEGVPFTEAAEAQRKKIEASPTFHKSCDEVKIVQVRAFEDVQSGLKQSKDIVQMWFYTHSGTGILYLDMRSREASSNIAQNGGRQTVTALFGLLGEWTFEAASLKGLDKSNIKKLKPGESKHWLFVRGCNSTKIADQLGEHFGMVGNGVLGTSYYPRVNGEVVQTDSVGYAFIKALGLEDTEAASSPRPPDPPAKKRGAPTPSSELK